MDGHNNTHGYLQDELQFDNYDLINGNGWPAENNNHQQFFQQPSQDQYARYTPAQTSYENFNLSQAPSYPATSFSSAPYPSQFQSGRQADLYDHHDFSIDPSLGGSSYQSSFSPFAPQAESATISPQSLQYSMPPTTTVSRAVSNEFQQRATNNMATTFAQRPPSHSATAMYYNNVQNNNNQVNQAGLVRYPALSNTSDISQKTTTQNYFEQDASTLSRAQTVRPPAPPPNPLRITRPDLIAQQASTGSAVEHAPFLNWENDTVNIALGLKNSLPKYHPRKPRSNKELVPGLDLSRASTAAQPTAKRGRPPKEKLLVSTYKGTSQAPRPVSEKVHKLREDGTSAASPSTTSTDSSPEGEEGSSEEGSDYEDDEMEIDWSKVREEVRPTAPDLAARWDVLDILYKGENASPISEVVKDAIEKYGNFVSALRMKIKNNSTKTEAAASNPAELQALKDERKVLLETFYQTVDAAAVHGCASIVDHLGSHHKLVNGLTTTLIECIKADDFQGKLPKAVFRLLARFQNMTDELLKKLKFDSIQKRWNKKGDEETKKLVTSILANTTDAKEKAAQLKQAAEDKAVKPEDDRKSKEKADFTKNRVSEASSITSSNSLKRSLESETANGKPPTKKIASGASIPISSLKPAVRRPTGNLLGIASKPIKPVPKKRELSPPMESKLGALLASIEKPPEAPKAPAAPPRAPETPEDKAKRERKESRRHLRVKFKEGSELEQVRLFKHEQAEDEGRQDEMLRDAHDDRLEGMMHKKRVSETENDDDEEYTPMDVERPYSTPIVADLTSLEKKSRFGPSYSTRGGEVPVSSPEQETQKHREAVELMVVYTDPSDIPPSAKEPSHMDESMEIQERDIKPSVEPWFQQRLQKIQQYGPENASRLFFTQPESQNRDKQNQVRIDQAANPPQSVATILQQLVKPPSAPPQPAPMPRVATEFDWTKFELLIDSLKGKPYPPTDPPDWMTDPAARQEWYDGLARDKEKQRLAGAAQAAPVYRPPPITTNFQQVPSTLPFPMPVPQMSAGIQQQPDVAQQVRTLLAGYQTPSSGALPPPQQFDYNGWSGNNTGGQNGYAVQNGYAAQDPPRGYEPYEPWNDSTTSNKTGGKKKQQHNLGMQQNDSPFDENGQYKGKKKPCRFYQEGKCAKGAACTYLHDD